MRLLQIFGTWLLALIGFSAQASVKWEWRDGDRVAFVGGVFMEREQDDGYIETMLTLSAPGRAVIFRNFGWGGDMVESHIAPKVPARPKYVPNLFSYLEQYKPTVVFISYGMMESFCGEAGLAEFTANYGKLLDRVSEISGPRIVLVSPFRHEQVGGHFPDPAEHNRQLQLYVAATEKLAADRNLTFVNLFESLPVAPATKKRMTSNGVHLNAEGYQQAAVILQRSLGLAQMNLKKAELETLRAAIQHKNKQWWFHYRPMNSEYVYPGGTRYQNDLGGIRHPMFSEIEEYARRTEQGDKTISELLKGDSIQKPSARKKGSAISPVFENAPDPELERKTFQVAEGLEVNLFAADPKITKPVQMAFDQRGRLWVATTTHYPQIKPGEEPTDSIIILEDVNGDGRADKTIVFADGLVIPTGVLPYRDGAFVFDDTTLLFLRDTNGDGRADKREVVLSGFGTEDSHHKGHTLRWGPEGRVHFNVGVFLHNNIETAHGLVSLSGYWQPGIFAYDPLTGKLDVHLANSVPPNPWGHYWNRWGFDFHIDSSGQQGSNLVLPTSNRTSSAIPVPGGHGKLAGGELISGRHFPESWQGNLVSAPFKENRLARWEFSDDGAGYAMKPMPPVIVSSDTAFRPVDHLMGPDGALYVADWYNPLIGHMQHHFRDPARDFTHGRIWRITVKDRALVPRPKIAGNSVKQLLEHLKAPEDYTRLQARRELAERSAKEVVPLLNGWVKNLNPTDANYDHQRVEALWVYQSLKVVEPELLKNLLQADDPNARAAATVTLRAWHNKISDALSLLAGLVSDPHPRVRLQAVITLSYIADVRSVELAMSVLDQPIDRYLEQALKNTILALKPQWEPALAKDELPFGRDPKRVTFLLKNAALETDPKVLSHLLRADQVAPENLERTIRSIVNNGSKADLERLATHDFKPDVQARVFAGLTRAARERKVILAPEWHARLNSSLQHRDEALRTAALQLAGAWKVEGLRPEMEAIAQDGSASMQLRKGAVQGLVYLGGEPSAAFLVREIQKENDPAFRQILLSSFVELDIASAAKTTTGLLRFAATEGEISSLLKPFLQRNQGADALGEAIAKHPIHPDNAKLGLRLLQKAGRQDQVLVEALNAAAGLGHEAKELSRQELQELAREVLAKGDAARGELVFRRPELSCFQCHAISGAGSPLGPDLSAIGSGSSLDYLIESLLYPNKVIKDGFESIEIITHDDEYFLGIKVRENPREIVLKDVARNEIVIPANSIKEKTNKAMSLMPAGLTASLTHGEFLDLCRFLGELGRPGPYANNPNFIVRRWQYVAPAPEQNDLASEALLWLPVYSTVSGFLPLEEISENGSTARVWLRTQIEVTTPGRIQFRLNSIEGLRLFINGKEAELATTTAFDFNQGVQTVVFEVDLQQRKSGVLMEFERFSGSPGRFQLITGR